MRTFLLILILLLTAQFAFAQTNVEVNTGYNHYASTDSDDNDDYQHINAGVSAKINERHNLYFNYGNYSDLHKKYDDLTKYDIGYNHTANKLALTAFATSASDKPFDSMDVTTIGAGAAYNVYTSQSGNMLLYLGLMGFSDDRLIGTYVIPTISFRYVSEHVQVGIGLPETFISITPTPKHIFMIKGLIYEFDASYTYKPMEDLALKLIISNEVERFRIAEFAEDDDEEHFMYKSTWVKGSASYDINPNINIAVQAGYLLDGHTTYGEDPWDKPQEELEDIYSIGGELRFRF